MPLKSYGVLAARAVDRRREGADDDTPHFQIHLVDEAGTHYRAAVNVKSQESPSELLYRVDENFRHALLDKLPAAGSGWTDLPTDAGGAALDYVRGDMLDRAGMKKLPADAPGPDNDLADVLEEHVQRAVADDNAAVYVFGERWGPEDGTPDKIFGFEPGNGVHDVHMNQGNSERFQGQDGVWQDGALLIHLPADDQWIALFLAFQSQSWNTDDSTGHAEDAGDRPGEPDQPTEPDRPTEPSEPTDPDLPGGPGDGNAPAVRIHSALINPQGPAPERETVTLLNTSRSAVDLGGWHLADRGERRVPLPAQRLEPGATFTVAAADGLRLGNRGGTITLLDDAGATVHTVTYSEGQARQEGSPVVFDA
ncbi:DUF2278 family protein [Streptomyces sp. B-S-A8]|uniref:DUF2278 family protein n=1 Tax=Streptomyces solicavernae TaxID=3043614 RepID=A0ABT6S0F1_9ACTN|nr:DUF2278 family protein [Streptomyces sp. B-S-A8]MDI3389904.1 DUF2278 family protein [Streptomyces sp. B-S-A8]